MVSLSLSLFLCLFALYLILMIRVAEWLLNVNILCLLLFSLQTTHLVVNNPERAADSYKGRMAQKWGIPVVSMTFIDRYTYIYTVEPSLVKGHGIKKPLYKRTHFDVLLHDIGTF